MDRIRVTVPDTLTFDTEIPIRIGDINYGGHLGNDAVLSIVHEARVRFLGHHGFTEHDVGGAGIILRDAALVFRAEAFYGQTIRAEVGVTEFSRFGCEMVYRLADGDTGKEIALARTGVVFFDYERRKPVGVPEAFRAVVEAEGGGTAEHAEDAEGE